MRRAWRRMSFRVQLVVLIAGVFTLGGSALLVAQYVLLRVLLMQRVVRTDGIVAETGHRSGAEPFEIDEELVQSTRLIPAWMQPDPELAELLRGVQFGSGALLFAFTGFAVVGAWLLSRRVFRRIGEVTDATNAITERDLSQRLDLPGPEDEIHRLGAAVDGMIARLEAAFIRQDAFIANASHEFRTPLATTRTALQVAVRQGKVSPSLMPDIADVLEANQRLEELVSTLLVVARGRAQTELPVEPVDVTALTQSLCTEYAPLAKARHLSYKLSHAGQHGTAEGNTVEGNPALLRSLISNLLLNAIRHNIDAGEIELTVSSEADRVALSVENSGPVLTREAIERLTEPFHRGEHSRLRPVDGSDSGTGLGLTLVESITTLHGGTLTFAARPGGGLIVTVELPAAVTPR